MGTTTLVFAAISYIAKDTCEIKDADFKDQCKGRIWPEHFFQVIHDVYPSATGVECIVNKDGEHSINIIGADNGKNMLRAQAPFEKNDRLSGTARKFLCVKNMFSKDTPVLKETNKLLKLRAQRPNPNKDPNTHLGTPAAPPVAR